MNIFILDLHPVAAAKQQCDKHIVKMILESAQMLSTAHRLLDGRMGIGQSKTGRKAKTWQIDDPVRDTVLYKAVHINHPCTIWTMESSANYHWHFKHYEALHDEYQYRYGKTHRSFTELAYLLKNAPDNIPYAPLTPFKLAMGAAPECINPADPVGSYRAFYQTKQDRFKMTWTKRDVPSWFQFA
jgi:hypothetical protein